MFGWLFPKRSVSVQIGFGEACDRLTILQLKIDHATSDVRKLLTREFALIHAQLYHAGFFSVPYVQTFALELAQINRELWYTENQIRELGGDGAYDPEHAKHLLWCEAARRVYTKNGERASCKRSIDNVMQSKVMEVKLYGSSNDRSGHSGEKSPS
jgi:hypothetical protein